MPISESFAFPTPEKAFQTLWRGRISKDGKPPSIEDWRRWTHPTPSLPIDEIISELKAARKKLKCTLRDRAILQSEWRVPFCPYYEIRHGIVAAASHAKLAQRSAHKGLKVEKPRLKQLATDAAAIADRINHFSKRWYSNDLNEAAIFDVGHKLHFFLNDQFELLQEADALRNIFRSIAAAAIKEKSVVAPGGSPVGIWHQEFIKRMGFVFRFLTGSDPSNSKAFREFINATYKSLNEESVIPESSIRTLFGRIAKHKQQRGWSWEARIAGAHNYPAEGLSSPDKEEARYDYLLKVTQQSAHDVLEDVRYLESFCGFLIMGGARLERDMQDSLPQLKQLPGWKKAYQAALARS